MEQFKDKTVLISGAGKGIGKGILLSFAEHGAKVAFFDKDETLVQDISKSLQALGTPHLTEVIDISDLSKINHFVDKVETKFGPVEVLINNVGFGLVKKFAETSPSDLNQVLKINFSGPFFLTQRILQTMPEESNVIFITSIHAHHPSLDPSYDCSKAAINTLITNLALDYAKRKIRVNGIAPGHIDISGNNQPRFQEDVPLRKQAGLPKDIADACLFLADNSQAGYITGEILHITGGLHIPKAADLKI